MRRFVVDAQLPPSLARFLSQRFEVAAEHVEAVGLRDARDIEIASWARENAATVITKDQDFVSMAHAKQVPATLLVTCGNVTNARLREIMARNFEMALALLERGDPVVEIFG